MAKIKNGDNTKCWTRCGQIESHVAGGNAKWRSHVKNVWQSPTEWNILSPEDPAVVLSYTNSRDIES